ncbi:cytochrome P450 [Geopyxis carbonaria]|nr:cytochrome P450 [Geopyxis carbonaria]
MLLQYLVQSLPAVAAALVVAALLSWAASKIRANHRIRKLGGRAKTVPSRFFGIDQTILTLREAKVHRNRELWEERFSTFNTHTMELSVLGQRIILTADPANIKALLATQFHDFGKGEAFHHQWAAFLGDSIFTTDGAAWHGSRTLLRPQFVKDRISDIHCFERHLRRMMALIPDDGGVATVDIQDLLFRFTLDTATDFLLGESVDSLGTPRVAFAQAFAEIQAHMNTMSRAGPFEVLFPQARFRRNLKILNDFVEPFVERTLAMRPEELKGRNESSYNFLHALAEFTREKHILRDQLVAILLAARDTTAGTLSWVFHELAGHPDVVERLRREILERVGETREPTYTDLKEMKYLQHVINETLRLYPAVPFNVRVALKDTYLPHGNAKDENESIGILKGTIVAYSTLTMQRREDLFGPDVAQFIPERWEKWVPKSWQFVPFNGGPRICIGQQFALTEMGYTIVRMLQKFDRIESRATGVQKERCEITITPSEGVKVALRPAARQL